MNLEQMFFNFGIILKTDYVENFELNYFVYSIQINFIKQLQNLQNVSSLWKIIESFL